MAPFYALTTFLSIAFNDDHGYLTLIRDIYEAVLIYTFFNLLSSYLAYDPTTKDIIDKKIYDILSQKGSVSHFWPFNYMLKDIQLSSEMRGYWFFSRCKYYILQFLAIKPASSFFIIVLYMFGDSP
mmetsp:Transcript_32627/g.29502  ORF Transcript_32627/g.29502 Transcript_32627/m.29502 type:complete len:126 (+) Transcript_32627:162-539(+)